MLATPIFRNLRLELFISATPSLFKVIGTVAQPDPMRSVGAAARRDGGRRDARRRASPRHTTPTSHLEDAPSRWRRQSQAWLSFDAKHFICHKAAAVAAIVAEGLPRVFSVIWSLLGPENVIFVC